MSLACAEYNTTPYFHNNSAMKSILERASLHAAELASVIRDEPEPEPARVSGDEEVVGSDHQPALLQVSTNLGIVGRGGVGKLENFDVRKERPQRSGILLSARRHFNTVQKLRFSVDRNADVRDRGA